MTTTLRERAGARLDEKGRARSERLYALLERDSADALELDPRLREGWLTDRYFLRAIGTLARDGRDPVVTMQIFSKTPGRLAGAAEGIRILEVGLSPDYELEDVEVSTMVDGDAIDPWEPAMHIRGPYRAFAHLETPLLGVLARRTLVCSNVAAAAAAAGGKPVVFMAARHDDWRVQAGDGYAALLGGAAAVSTDAGGSRLCREGAGTMPHALIAAYGGDTVAATLAFARYARDVEPGASVVSLVDYDNDAVETSLAVARAMRRAYGEGSLRAVRVDTSESLVDRSLETEARAVRGDDIRAFKGVNPALVEKVRRALDAEGFGDVEIWVSGGFSPAKIAAFERAGAPVDAYGVGSSLLGHGGGEDGVLAAFDFTADIVAADGAPQAKAGREYAENPRHVGLDWSRVSRSGEPAREESES